MGCCKTMQSNSLEKDEPGKTNRDLLIKFADTSLVPEPEPARVKVPCVDPTVVANVKTEKSAYMILPSQLLQTPSFQKAFE